MRKVIFPAIVAFIASCKPGQKLNGTYTEVENNPNHTRNDTVQIKREEGDRYQITRKTGWHFTEEGLKDTVAVRVTHGNRLENSNIIQEDSSQKLLQIQPKRQVLHAFSRTYRKMR